MNDPKGKTVYPIGKKNPNLPFHPAVRAGDYIFVSGQVAKDADGNMLSGTIEQETAGTIESIRCILAEEGASLSDVVQVTTSEISVATIKFLLSISRMQCLHGQLSRRAP
jgi:enamine deaminase RidA (YjgF/YER057c/UK114 family)